MQLAAAFMPCQQLKLNVRLIPKEDFMRFAAVMIFTAIFSILVLTADSFGQECGPGCPACSGKTMGDLQATKSVSGSFLYIPDGEMETAVFNLRYGIVSWLDVGIGYTLDAEETIWGVRLKPFEQGEKWWSAALLIGTGSVQTGGSDQSGYIIIAKSLEIIESRFGISLAGGYATDLPDLKKDWGMGTFSMTFYDRFSPFYTYDGVGSHLGLTFFATEWLSLSGYLLEMEELALSISIQWIFSERNKE